MQELLHLTNHLLMNRSSVILPYLLAWMLTFLMAECNRSDRMIQCFDSRRLRFCPDPASLMLLLQRHTMVTTLANRRLTAAATMEVRSDQRVVVGLRLVYVDSPSVVRDFIHESNARGRHSEPVLRQDEIRKHCVEKAVH
jgi:hypothetical protein